MSGVRALICVFALLSFGLAIGALSSVYATMEVLSIDGSQPPNVLGTATLGFTAGGVSCAATGSLFCTSQQNYADFANQYGSCSSGSSAGAALCTAGQTAAKLSIGVWVTYILGIIASACLAFGIMCFDTRPDSCETPSERICRKILSTPGAWPFLAAVGFFGTALGVGLGNSGASVIFQTALYNFYSSETSFSPQPAASGNALILGVIAVVCAFIALCISIGVACCGRADAANRNVGSPALTRVTRTTASSRDADVIIVAAPAPVLHGSERSNKTSSKSPV